MMDLEKYKVCPECGKHNAPNLLECRFCEADLTGCKIVDKTTETAEPAKQKQAVSTEERPPWFASAIAALKMLLKQENVKLAVKIFQISFRQEYQQLKKDRSFMN